MSTIICKLRVTRESKPSDWKDDPQNNPVELRLCAVHEDKKTGANKTWAAATPSATLDVKVRRGRPSPFTDIEAGSYAFVIVERHEEDRHLVDGRYYSSVQGLRWYLSRLQIDGSQAKATWYCQWDSTDGVADGEFEMIVDNRDAWTALGIDNMRTSVNSFCDITVIPCGKDDEWPAGWPR